MGLDDSFPPMGFRDDNGELVGFDIDVAKEVAKRLDVELVLQPIDWAVKEQELATKKLTSYGTVIPLLKKESNKYFSRNRI